MISLKFLSLAKLSKKHHDELYDDMLDKFKVIEVYIKALDALQTSVAYPETDIDRELLVFAKGKREELKPSKTHFPDPVASADFLKVLAYLKKNLSLTLKGTPHQADQLVRALLPILSKYHKPGEKFGYLPNFKHFAEALKYIWSYSAFIGKATDSTSWDAYQLAAFLDVNVCPYCNRMYTYTVSNKVMKKKKWESEKLIRPEFDHFYSKGRYPFLALCLQNLVPSCSICNSTLKGEIEMTIHTHCHPYVEGYEDVCAFETGVAIKDYLEKRKPSIPVNFVTNLGADVNHQKRAEATHNVFKISKIYPSHADIAKEMFLKSTDDSKRLVEGFWNQVSLNGKHLFDSKEDLYRHFIGNHYRQKDFYKRPLAKFQYDILKEMKLVKYIDNLPDRPTLASAVPMKII